MVTSQPNKRATLTMLLVCYCILQTLKSKVYKKAFCIGLFYRGGLSSRFCFVAFLKLFFVSYFQCYFIFFCLVVFFISEGFRLQLLSNHMFYSASHLDSCPTLLMFLVNVEFHFCISLSNQN